MTRFIFSLCMCFVALTASGQSIESFIAKVNDSHPAIIAGRELLTAKEVDSRTGATPEDPMVNLGYFPGKPDNIGNKITWAVSQSIDFPTRYKRIKDLKRTNFELAELELQYSALLILNAAHEKAIELISSKRKLEIFEDRLIHLRDLENAYNKMLDLGETTIIEYNKIKITEAGMLVSFATLESKIQSLEIELDFMSNGNSKMLEGVSFTVFGIFNPDSVLAVKKLVHPAFKIPIKELEMSEREVNLSRTASLPAFELGYASEIVANEEFIGPTFGMSIPLWKNKGKVKTAIATNKHYMVKAESEIKLLEANFQNEYSRWLSARSNLENLRSAVSASDSRMLLGKALELGEISLIDYIIELTTYYEIEDNLVTIEKEFNLHLARIFDHTSGAY